MRTQPQPAVTRAPQAPSTRLAEQAIDALVAAGVVEWCVCAGARNVPLVSALRRLGARRFHLYDERSAGFFALGRIKATGRPVAVVTTSGTAAAELFPAMVEAFHSGLPLVAVTADRPRRLRGTGAPQTIDQTGLFGRFAPLALDLEAGEGIGPTISLDKSPSHWNLCFDEPLVEMSEEPETDPLRGRCLPVPAPLPPPPLEPLRARLASFLEGNRQPVVVVGPLRQEDVATVAKFLEALGAPILAEAPSGLRGCPALEPLALQCGERSLAGAAFDSVLRIGGVPCTRLWRDLEESRRDLAVLSVTALPFPGLSRGECLVVSPAELLADFAGTSGWERSLRERLLARDRRGAAALDRCLAEEPQSEPALVRALSRLVPADSLLYLGNSLPIREWDLAADRTPRGPAEVSRGVNGIDGQLSTFFGCAKPETTNWALFGDLTTLYDLGAPWVLEQRPEVRAVLAVINNGGGRIFGRMFAEPELENRHRRGFASWATMWELAHELWRDVPSAWTPERNTVLEIVPNDEATDRFWRKYEAAWR